MKTIHWSEKVVETAQLGQHECGRTGNWEYRTSGMGDVCLDFGGLVCDA